MSGATVTIDYAQFQEIQNKRNDAEKRVAELEAQVAKLKLAGGGDVSVEKLTLLARQLMEIARFAVGNLPPESTRGWPVGALTTSANLLKELPDHTIADQEMGIEWMSFASEAERFERRRQMLKGQIGS